MTERSSSRASEPSAAPQPVQSPELSAQPSVADGVHTTEGEDGMATLAINPATMLPTVQSTPTVPSDRVADGGDAELMLRLKGGDLDCFEILMNKYRRPIVHFMYRMVHNQAVAEEMAQEVFLRLFRALPGSNLPYCRCAGTSRTAPSSRAALEVPS